MKRGLSFLRPMRPRLQELSLVGCRLRKVVAALPLAIVLAAPPALPAPAHVHVTGGTGQKLASVKTARRNSTIHVRGTCNERVTITTDGLKLHGHGKSVLDGAGLAPGAPEFNGLLTIDGARRVVIRGFTIQNSSGEGILARNGAAFTLRNSTVQQNGFTGVAVSDHSVLHLKDSSIVQNLFGLDVFNTSNAVLYGNVDITNNFAHGVTASTSTIDLRLAHLNISNNGGFGAALNRRPETWRQLHGAHHRRLERAEQHE